MVPFGYSIGDIILLAEKSYKLYEAVNDSRKNAPRQARLLAEEFKRFSCRLKDLHRVLIQHGRSSYVGLQAFATTLEECEELVEKYSVLNDDGAGTVRRSYRTMTWTMEEKNIERLRAQVAGHVLDIILFENGLMMEALFDLTKILNAGTYSSPLERRWPTRGSAREGNSVERCSDLEALPNSGAPSECGQDSLDQSQLTLERAKNELKRRAYTARQQPQNRELIEAKQLLPISSLQDAEHLTMVDHHVPKDIREKLAELLERLSSTTNPEELSQMAWVAGQLLERAENLSKRNHGAMIQSRSQAVQPAPLPHYMSSASPQQLIRASSTQCLPDYITCASTQTHSPAGALRPPSENTSRGSLQLHSQSGSFQTSPRSTVLGSIFTATTPGTEATDLGSPSSLTERGSGISTALAPPDVRSFQLPEPAKPLSFSSAFVALELDYDPEGTLISISSIIGEDFTIKHVLRSKATIPHLEHSDADDNPAYIVSFKQDQDLTIIRSSHSESCKSLDLEYHFTTQTDLDRFQEALTGRRLKFSADISSINDSRGRQLCSHQVLRIWATNDHWHVIFFRNLDRRGYVDYTVTNAEPLQPVFRSAALIRMGLVPESAPELPARRRSSVDILFSRTNSTQTEHGAKYIDIEFTSHADRDRLAQMFSSQAEGRTMTPRRRSFQWRAHSGSPNG